MRTAGTRLPGPDRLWKPWLSDAGDVYVWSLFGQNVTQVSVLVLKTTFTGFFEALSSTAYGLNFWHFNNFHFALLINETKANKACEARRLHRQCYLKALLFLLRSEHHDHLAAFDLRWEGFDHCQFLQIVFHAIKHFHTDLLVRHLTTAETQRDFGFITLFEKANQAAEFYLIVAFICTRTEFNFLNLDNFLLFLLFLRRLALS